MWAHALENRNPRRAESRLRLYTESSPKAIDFRFFETRAQNRGYSVQLFTEPEKALRWLRGE